MKETPLASLFIACAIVIAALLGYLKMGEFNKNQAIQECFKTSVVQWTNPDNSGYTFMDDWMNNCIDSKGY